MEGLPVELVFLVAIESTVRHRPLLCEVIQDGINEGLNETIVNRGRQFRYIEWFHKKTKKLFAYSS